MESCITELGESRKSWGIGEVVGNCVGSRGNCEGVASRLEEVGEVLGVALVS